MDKEHWCRENKFNARWEEITGQLPAGCSVQSLTALPTRFPWLVVSRHLSLPTTTKAPKPPPLSWRGVKLEAVGLMTSSCSSATPFQRIRGKKERCRPSAFQASMSSWDPSQEGSLLSPSMSGLWSCGGDQTEVNYLEFLFLWLQIDYLYSILINTKLHTAILWSAKVYRRMYSNWKGRIWILSEIKSLHLSSDLWGALLQILIIISSGPRQD